MQKPFENSSDRIGSFKLLTEQFSTLAEKEGVSVVPYSGAAPSFFPALPEGLQAMILGDFRRYVDVCNATIEEGRSLRQDSFFLWRMFQKLGVHPPSDLMSSITNEDIIEIYNTEYVQIFRNLRFFEVCSYTLDDILARPFWELFRREEIVTNRIVTVARAFFMEERKDIYRWDVGMHRIEEIDSPMRYRSEIEQRLVAPLFDSTGKISALVNTIRCLSSVPGV